MTTDIKKLRAELRNAIADYMWSEGCGCCRDQEAHDQHEERMAKLLNAPKYKDGSGYDFHKYRTKTPVPKLYIEGKT